MDISSAKSYVSSSSAELTQTYLGLLDHMVALGREYSYNLRAKRGGQPLVFASLPVEMQEQVVAGVRSYMQWTLQAHADGADLDDAMDGRHLWLAMRSLGLRFRDDFFGLLEKDDVVEIYNTDNIQIFRSWTMFRYLSYTLDEVLCNRWFDLYEREAVAQAQVETATADLFSGVSGAVRKLQVDIHEVSERASDQLLTATMQPGHGAPLYAFGQRSVAGFIQTFRILSVGSKKVTSIEKRIQNRLLDH